MPLDPRKSVPHEPRKLVADALDCASFIFEMTRDVTFDQFRDSRVIRQVVERNFEIIGEALNRLRRVDPASAAKLAEHPRIISFRNILAHGYDIVDPAIIWTVVHDHLPAFHAAAGALLVSLNAK
jgi:uncharacterized protein with HEPN domain